MREIKFRAWDTPNKYMITHKELCLVPLTYNEVFKGKDGYPLMQYTGLKDKNGVEIYDGDIVKYYQAEYNEETELREDRITVCEWYEDCYALIQRDAEGMLITPFNILRTKVIEVIGNIYENKELLES